MENAPHASVLLVDDGKINHDILGALLEEAGYEVRHAMDGASALEMLQASPPPDLVLLDVMMPGIDGYEVCRRVKALDACRDIPVIFVTGKQEIEDETLGFEVGCVDFILKPISAPVLLARVATHVKLHRLLRERGRG